MSGLSATAANPVMNMIFMPGIEFGRTARKFDAVHFRHHNISQQKLEAFRLDALIRAHALAVGHHFVARVLKCLNKKTTHILIVFGKQNLCHWTFRRSTVPRIVPNLEYTLYCHR